MPRRQVKPHPFPGTGARIREARLGLGLSCEQLGALVGSNKALVSGWELDKVWPHEKKAEALERALGIELPRHIRSGRGRISTGKKPCANPACGEEFPTFFGEMYCSRECAAVGKSEIMKGKNFKSGRTVDVKGYVHILVQDEHPRKNAGYVREHVLVMERKLGRYLLSKERVHHKNGNRGDNHPDNLELWVSKGTNTKDPPGQRVSDLIDHALEADVLRDMPDFWREAVRRSLYRVMLNTDPVEAPYDPADDAKPVNGSPDTGTQPFLRLAPGEE